MNNLNYDCMVFHDEYISTLANKNGDDYILSLRFFSCGEVRKQHLAVDNKRCTDFHLFYENARQEMNLNDTINFMDDNYNPSPFYIKKGFIEVIINSIIKSYIESYGTYYESTIVIVFDNNLPELFEKYFKQYISCDCNLFKCVLIKKDF